MAVEVGGGELLEKHRLYTEKTPMKTRAVRTMRMTRVMDESRDLEGSATAVVVAFWIMKTVVDSSEMAACSSFLMGFTAVNILG